MAGRVDDVDAVVVPDARGGGGRDGDATLLLLRHVVHGRGAVVHFTDLVALARVVEDALGGSGLAGVDVGHDADIACALQGEFALGHLVVSLLSCCDVGARNDRKRPMARPGMLPAASANAAKFAP